MPRSKTPVWVALVTSGLAVAAFTFVGDKVWQVVRHRSVGPEYVDTSIRLEEGRVLLFVRNNSDDALDLVRATITLNDPSLVATSALGAYPDISKVYTVESTVGPTTVAAEQAGLVLNVGMAQAIEPRGADQFGFSIAGLAGPIDLTRTTVRAVLHDIRGNTYSVSP